MKINEDLRAQAGEMGLCAGDNVVPNFTGRYAFLSNFTRENVYSPKYEIWFPSRENAYQSLKFLDPERAREIALMTPAEAKRAGRNASLARDWRENPELSKLDAMAAVLYSCFVSPSASPASQERLLSTGDAYLEEGNYWGDRFWGTEMGEGENRLGWLLMYARTYLRKGWEPLLEDKRNFSIPSRNTWLPCWPKWPRWEPLLRPPLRREVE